MKVKEAIKKIKESELFSIWDAEEILFEDKNTKEVASDLDIDERRWYINSTSFTTSVFFHTFMSMV